MLLRAYMSSLQLILKKYFLCKGNTKIRVDTKLRTKINLQTQVPKILEGHPG